MEAPEGLVLSELRLMSAERLRLHFLFQTARKTPLRHTSSISPLSYLFLPFSASFSSVLCLLPPTFTSSLTVLLLLLSLLLSTHLSVFQLLPSLRLHPFTIFPYFVLLLHSFTLPCFLLFIPSTPSLGLLSSLPPSLRTFPQPVSLHVFVLVSLLIFKHVNRIHHTFIGSVLTPK